MNFFHQFSVVMMVIFVININSVFALDSGEIVALKDMQAEWGAQLGWTGPPSCSWYGIICDSNGNVVQMCVFFLHFCFFLRWNKSTYLAANLLI